VTVISKCCNSGTHPAPIKSTALSLSIAAPGSDRLMNARQLAAKLGVSER